MKVDKWEIMHESAPGRFHSEHIWGDHTGTFIVRSERRGFSSSGLPGRWQDLTLTFSDGDVQTNWKRFWADKYEAAFGMFQV